MLYSLRYILLGVLLMTSSAWGKEVNHEQHLERRSVRVECADLPCASVDTFDLTSDLSPCDTVVIMRRRTSRAQADADMSESRIQDNRDRGSRAEKERVCSIRTCKTRQAYCLAKLRRCRCQRLFNVACCNGIRSKLVRTIEPTIDTSLEVVRSCCGCCTRRSAARVSRCQPSLFFRSVS